MSSICKFSCLAALLLACNANLGSLAPLETGSEGDESTTGEDHEPFVCIGGELCPTGSRCANGLCATECRRDPECATDEYCGLDGLCHPNMVPGCNSDQDCAATQTCINQLCVGVDEQSCDPLNYVQDGCASNSLCIDDYDDDDEGICYEMPACAADQSCPIGLEGAVCNTGQYPNKDEICLFGMCVTNMDCPAQWSCVFYGNSVLGLCSNGVFASPCAQNSDCISMTCLPLPGLGGGVCG